MRKERRRIHELSIAREQGEQDARVMWLLPFQQRTPYEEPLFACSTSQRAVDPHAPVALYESQEVHLTERDPSNASEHISIFDTRWQVPSTFVWHCRPSPEWFPPIFETRQSTLCDLYVASAEKVELGWNADLLLRVPVRPGSDGPEPAPTLLTPESSHHRPLPVERSGVTHLAADQGDLDRWQEAAVAYLTELNEVVRQVSHAWCDYGHRIALSSRRTRRRFERWRSTLMDGHDRLARASDRYRPVHDEVRAQIEETSRTHLRMGAQFSRLFRWQQREAWYLTPSGPEEFRIARTDEAGPAPTGRPVSLQHVIEAAKEKRRDLHRVDWHPDSVHAADGELAAITARLPPSGTTPRGLPMAPAPSPSLFALVEDWFRLEVKDLSDPAELERDRARHAEWEEERARSAPQRSSSTSSGGSYPTYPGGGDFGGFGGFTVHT
ncbi:hypothetical protein ABZ815_25465 [Nonomuraea sp. NPDC047529]|uniref:hypothetical protein n=1 Tax=Nonomuraea sp. NPDC047529 TaxID=3155623 RepID=UPI0033E132C4